MIKSYIKKTFLNKFLKKIIYKKEYLNKLNNKFIFLNKNNVKKWDKNFNIKTHNNFLILYVIEILFNETNTLIQITNSFGKLKFFCSAGYVFFKGKAKKARLSVIKKILKILVQKLPFLRNKPTILRVINVGLKKNWVLKKLKKKIFIKTLISKNCYSYNGCRKKKLRRKNKEMAEWFKATDCKFVKFSCRGFESHFLY